MAKKTNSESVEVNWSSGPLDVALERHGSRKPARKVKVRGILRDGEGGEDETDAVTPDPIVTCPKCHKRFRVGRAKA